VNQTRNSSQIEKAEIKELNDGLSAKTLAQLLGLTYIDRLPDPIPPRGLVYGDFDRIAGSWGRQHSTIPFSEDGQEVLVATSDPLNTEAIDQLRLCYKRPIRLVVTSSEEIARAINAIRTSLMSDRSSSLNADGDSESEDFQTQLKIDVTDAEDDDAPIIRYVNAIIFKASSERASDVHIEPYEDKLNVRFRIDGVLHDVASEDKSFQAAIISRVKVMSGLNIAEKRLPQDGRIGLKIAGKDVDIRVSTIPTQFGERIVMRLLDKSATVLDLEEIGITGKKLKDVEKLIVKPNGIILVTGPTGSGKTTTLYSCLSKINTPDLNILTVEDPIEYQLDGIGQMQVNPKIDFTFATGLRAILRQDPDVVMVGEIRDAETAEIAIQASLTGHLVLSTLHTNDSSGAITRLLDMGVEPFLVASSLLAVMAQRLVRRLCKHCAEPYEISDEELTELGVDPASVAKRTVYKPGTKPCTVCSNNRYLGRTGIHELLIMDDTLRSLILQRVDSGSIKNAATERGFLTLRLDGAQKILQGVTSVEEVLLATHEELA
jgi:general secretion pathway protein E